MKIMLLISILMTFACTLLSQTAAPPVGDGSAGNPYQIATLDNLYWVTQNSSSWSSYFIQTADIDADSTHDWASGAGFTPIGNGTTAFSGSYNGQSHRISRLYINRGTQYNGLFGFVGIGSVKNLELDSVLVTGGDLYTGGLVGYLYYSSTVTNCSSTGSVSGTFYVGGLIGSQDASSSTSSSYSGGSVTGSNGGIGGLIGISGRNSYIKNCYSTASVTGTNSAFSIGGLLGGENTNSDTNCYSTGLVRGTSSSSNVGGLIGMHLYSSVSNCFWDTATSGLDTSGAGTGENTPAMKTQSTFTDAGWDFTNVWSISPDINNGYPYLAPNPPTFVEGHTGVTPKSFSLLQNYPNPFNPGTTIHFELAKESRVRLNIYNILGQEVLRILDEKRPAGVYDVNVNAGKLSSGMYIYRLSAGDFIQAKKMLLLK